MNNKKEDYIMKYVTMGVEESRYTLIIMKRDSVTNLSIDDTVTYYKSYDINELIELKDDLRIITRTVTKKYYLDIVIYDSQERRFVR